MQPLETTLGAQLQELESEQLLRRLTDAELAYMFKHALTQETAYESLLHKRRQEIHLHIAQAYEDLYPEELDSLAALLEHHYSQVGDHAKIAEYAIRAGDGAARVHAYPEARAHYAQALEALLHLPDSTENRRRRVDTIVKQASLSFIVEPPQQTIARLLEAESLARHLSEEENPPIGDRLRLARIRYWMGRAHFAHNELHQAISCFRQVLPIAEEYGDEELMTAPSAVIGRVMLIQGYFNKALPLLSRAATILEKGEIGSEWILTLGFRNVALAEQGNWEMALAEGQRVCARAQATNNLTGIAVSRILQSALYLLLGERTQMLQEARIAKEIAEQSGDRLYAYLAYGFQGWAESRLGDHDAAIKSMQQSNSIVQRLGGNLVLADWLAAARSEIALNAGRVEEALGLAEQTVAAADENGGIFAVGLAHRVWAFALAAANPQHWDEIEEHIKQSLQVFAEGGALLEKAHTHAAWGALCYQHSQYARSREHLLKAIAQFQESGLVTLRNEAQSLLSRLPD